MITESLPFEITMHLANTGNMLAQFSLVLNTKEFGPVEIKGFRVTALKDTEDLWIQPPAYRSSVGWSKIIYFVNKEVWKAIEDCARKEYEKVKSEGQEIVDPSEIPF